MNESCCSLRRISRTRKIVFTTTPAMMTRKKIDPKTMRTLSRQLMSSQPTFSVTAAATRQIPRMVKKMARRCRPLIIRDPVGFAPRTPLQALSRAAAPARSVHLARSLRSLARCYEDKSFPDEGDDVGGRERRRARAVEHHVPLRRRQRGRDVAGAPDAR